MINYFNDFNNPREFLFIKNDFLKKEIFDHYNSKIKALNWIQDERDSFWNNKISEFIDCSKIHEEIINLINKNFSLFKNNYFVKLSKNEFSSLSSHKKFFAENGQRIIAHYKIGIYFGNFDGGEIVFKDQNFIYKPKPNDCIIFKIHKDYNHYTEQINFGTRYAYQDFLIYTEEPFMP